MVVSLIFGGLSLANNYFSAQAAEASAKLDFTGQQIQSNLQFLRDKRESTEQTIADIRRIAKVRVISAAHNGAGASQFGQAIAQGVYDYNRDKLGDDIARIRYNSQIISAKGNYQSKKYSTRRKFYGQALNYGKQVYNYYADE